MIGGGRRGFTAATAIGAALTLLLALAGATAPAASADVITPAVVGDLTHVSGSYRTPYGEVRTEWTRQDGRVELTVTVPPGSTAEVHVPASGAVHQVGSGTWHFRSA